MIAADMRQKVYELMQQGKTKGQIVDYMVARYGHFVSYEPPLTAGTVLLWLGPGLFVLAGAGVIIARARRRDILTRRSAPKSASGWRHYCKKEKTMSLLVVIAGLLLAGALGLLYFPWSGKGAVDRDALNRALYQSRLQELAQERGEDNPALVVELQRTLLTDIPPQAQHGERPLSCWALLPGALLLVVLSLGLYLKTSDIGQVLLWQQAERHFPALLQQVKDPTAAPLRMDELAELRLGLRSHLQDTPNDLAGWQLLGRLGLLLNDGETAIGAFGRAHALSGDDPAAAFDYASALVRAGR